jgi:hypothetical protein
MNPNDLAAMDKIVGRIAGAIFCDIADVFPQPPLILVPPVTLKVKRVLETVGDVGALTKERRREIAHDIQVAIIPLLYSLDLDPVAIKKAAPKITMAAEKSLNQLIGGTHVPME